MSLEKVQQALVITLLTDFGTAYANRIAYENLAFTATPGKPWLSVHFMPASEVIATLGSNGRDEVNGILQVNIYLPSGEGEKNLRSIVNALRTTFKPQVLSFQGQGVTILSRSRANGSSQDGFYLVPFSVRWRTQLSRS